MRLVWILAALLGCTEPHFESGHLQCAASGRACPEGFYCALDGRCWADGVFPDLASSSLFDLGGADLAISPGADLSILIDMRPPPERDLAGNPSLCAGSTALVCDGFEGAALNTRWTVNTFMGTVGLDTSRFYRGGSSLHVHTDSTPTLNADPNANVYTYQNIMLPTSGTLYARVWAYFPSAQYSDDFDQVINFANTSGAGVAYATESWFPVDNDYAGGVYNASTTVGIPKDKWTCLQLSVDQTGATGAIHLYVDGVEATDASASGATTPALDHIYLGLDWAGNPAGLPASDAWLDELLVDKNPINCAD